MAVVDKGKVLFVDLTSGSIKEEKLEENLYRDFIGGTGLGARILYERIKAKIDPLGPDNLLGFVAGLLTGSPIPSACRYMLVAKSPLTGTWGDSNSGGYFGHELRSAGYSAVFFSGISPKPVYLWLHNGKAELRDAAHLWGKDTYETEAILRQELGDQRVRVARIGPSGESLSLLAGVINDEGDLAGRSGLGAVMGSKQLKAIAVRGTGSVPVADSDRLSALRKGIIKDMLSKTFETRRTYGTIDQNTARIISGDSPIKNWSLSGAGNFPNYMKIDCEEVIKHQIRRHSCWGCPLGCKGTFRVEKSPNTIDRTEKTEYETFCGFGPMCLNYDVESVIKAGDICNRYGIDTISTSTAIAFAMECYERGIISNKETDGIELIWGNASAMLAILDKIVRREGFGAMLADGVKRASEQIGRGSEKYAIHIHGQEPGYHDPRFQPARGTFYLCDPTPGRHTTSALTAVAEVGMALGPYPELKFPKVDSLDDYQAKGPIYATGSSYYQLINACGICFPPLRSGTFPIADCISAVTGWDFTMAEGLRAGRRIQTLRQAFNLREGLHPADFHVPQRISEPLITGPLAGRAIDFDALRQSFYAAMGWDTESGWPLESTLQELRLKELVASG